MSIAQDGWFLEFSIAGEGPGEDNGSGEAKARHGAHGPIGVP